MENYILKPWYPPEVHLYPLVGEFLSDWVREHRPMMELVRVIGTDPSPRAFEITLFFERNGIPCGFYPADSPAPARITLSRRARTGAACRLSSPLTGAA